ncbi:hypothetical protein GCM10008022_46750 [Paenibacillus hunanensis]|nr:hypothetical protein GCM10008022_46750 [Paenibacillus hunanensis]
MEKRLFHHGVSAFVYTEDRCVRVQINITWYDILQLQASLGRYGESGVYITEEGFIWVRA